MKSIIIYYSLSGNCTLVANILKTYLGADVLEIKTAESKKRTGFGLYFWGGSQVFMKKKPALKPYTVNIEKYDLVIFGTPVWAGSPAPALVSFLKNTKINGKKIALFCCHGGGIGKAMQKFKALLPENTVIGEIDFKIPARAEGAELEQKIGEWVKLLTKNIAP